MQKIVFTLLLSVICLAYNVKAQPYNHYFGNIHAHSSYSDGNQDSSTSMITRPIQDFNYAKNSQHIDFYGISEHNHLNAGMTSPVHFHQGLADANTATVNGTFIAMYGMEWGVISGGGHVVVYGYDSLMGWDANDYDVYVAQNDYTNLWKKINQKPGAFGYLAHPQTTDYNNLFSNPYDLSSDNAIVGLAARSGPATSTNSTYSNPSTGNYVTRYTDALKKGYHLGVGLDHDTHNSVFGRQTAGRMVVLAPTLTRSDILDAIRHMRFYSSDDWNLKVNFTISNLPMGSTLTQTGTPTIIASVVDGDASESVSSIAVYCGVPGSGTAASVLTTVTNTANLSYVHNLTNNTTYYYYLKITQADGDIVWTSPIWYTRNDAMTNTAPVSNFSASSPTVCVGQAITFNDNSTNGASIWAWSLPGASPNSSINQNVMASYNTAGIYTVNLSTSNAFGTSTIANTITVVPLPNLVISKDTICQGQGDSLRVTGASTYSWSTGATAATIYVAPTMTYFYYVTGTMNGCSSTTSTYLVVNTCVGIEELSKEPFKLYPNPTRDYLTIDFKELVNEKTIEIYNESGKLVLSEKTTDTMLKLNVSHLKNGIYVVKVVLDDKALTKQKFVIER